MSHAHLAASQQLGQVIFLPAGVYDKMHHGIYNISSKREHEYRLNGVRKNY